MSTMFFEEQISQQWLEGWRNSYFRIAIIVSYLKSPEKVYPQNTH
jgi:hypothetical protein